MYLHLILFYDDNPDFSSRAFKETLKLKFFLSCEMSHSIVQHNEVYGS